ncbi:MAG: histone deacetylase [Candidatus Bathyarchaeota archaeon]|nr:histone deacetylase [Candidatus Bathyarchaeota archaeon]
MTNTAVISSKKYLLHNTGRHHPESASRLRVIKRELEKSGILKNEQCRLVSPEPVKQHVLEQVHHADYIQKIKKFCIRGGGQLDKDTTVSKESYDVALLAAGGAVKAVELVMAGKYKNAFAFVRPPGHHAGPDYAMGFCVFNNVAVAASHLLNKFNLQRVLILDIDAHHGNGTQDIFQKTNKVLYISLHEDPIEFPLTGFADEVGEQKGKGYSINIPLPYGTDDKTYLKAFNSIAVPAINQYKPQFILVSTGFDNHYSDPIGNLFLSSRSYIQIFDTVLHLASRYCQDKMAAVLEGGYNLKFLGKLACTTTARMAEIPYSFKDKHPGAILKTRKTGQKTIQNVKNIQSAYWKL